MAYRRKTSSSSRRSYRKGAAKRTYKRKAAPKSRTYKKKPAKRAKRSQPRERRIVLVVQQAPLVSPSLAQPASKAAPQRARFGG